MLRRSVRITNATAAETAHHKFFSPTSKTSSVRDLSGVPCWPQRTVTRTRGTSTLISTARSPAVAGVALLVREYYMDGFYPSGTASPLDVYTPSGALEL